MEEINKFTDSGVFVDNNNFFPRYLLKYIEDCGIEINTNYENGRYIAEFSYNGERLNAKVYDDDIVLACSSCYVNIDKNTYTTQFKNNISVVNIGKTGNYEGLRFIGKKHSRIYVFEDMLGNITLSFEYNLTSHEVSIRIGEEHDLPEKYISELKNKIDFSQIEEADRKFVDLLISDPRIFYWLTEKMSKMAPDIETAYQNKVGIIKERYQKEIDMIIEKQDSDILDLTKYKDSYLKELADKEIGSKGK